MEGREFPAGTPVTATVGTLGGETVQGRLLRFQPHADEVVLGRIRVQRATERDPGEVRVPLRKVAFVALHRATHHPDAAAAARRTYEVDVHLAGGRDFPVRVERASLDDPAGFWGIPSVAYSLYSEIAFLRHAVNACEDKEPLGAMLVRDGVVGPDALDAVLLEQEALRSARLGDILVEQKHLDPVEVERISATQAERLRAGRRMKLGEILVEAGLVTEADVQAALDEQKNRRGKRLGEILVDMKVVDEQVLYRTLARKFHLDFVDLDREDFSLEAFREVPANVMRRFRVLPFRTDERTLTIAISDPLALEALDMLRFSSPKQILEVVATASQLESRLKALAGDDGESGSEIAALAQSIESAEDGAVPFGKEVSEADAGDSEMAMLVNRIITDAWRKRASDIHIEPTLDGHEVIVRFRVDGQCAVVHRLPGAVRRQIVGRIKILARMDIAESRKPQDGKIRVIVGDEPLELRVVTLPTTGGLEDVVMRLLARSEPIPLERLGLSVANRTAIQEVVRKPYGLILAVGPTGSGKTTTLHSLLGTINAPERKIWTAEDPVEITQPGLRQMQVNPRIGLTFAAAMRSFLRADPDVIMVGEMRDLETAGTAVEASLTGHLVFSTLHTNNAPETVTRLVDMGLDPFAFADSLLAVLAQRLARRLCPDCAVEAEADAEAIEGYRRAVGAETFDAILAGRTPTVRRAVGCRACEGRGYRGRVALHELLVADDDLRRIVQRKGTAAEVRDCARATGMRTLVEDGVAKCLEGVTDLRQVLSVSSR